MSGGQEFCTLNFAAEKVMLCYAECYQARPGKVPYQVLVQYWYAHQSLLYFYLPRDPENIQVWYAMLVCDKIQLSIK